MTHTGPRTLRRRKHSRRLQTQTPQLAKRKPCRKCGTQHERGIEREISATHAGTSRSDPRPHFVQNPNTAAKGAAMTVLGTRSRRFRTEGGSTPGDAVSIGAKLSLEVCLGGPAMPVLPTRGATQARVKRASSRACRRAFLTPFQEDAPDPHSSKERLSHSPAWRLLVDGRDHFCEVPHSQPRPLERNQTVPILGG